MAYQPVPELPDDTAENVPRVMGVRADDSLALAPAGLPLTGGTLTGDLQVNGQIRGPQGTQTAPTYSSVDDPTSGFYFGIFGGNPSAAISVAGVYRIHVGNYRTRIIDDLQVEGDLQVDGTINGTLAFGIAEGIDTADVLDRAETATMPVVDDKSVATTAADVENITVNEVVTALLAKIKELSARIETLEQQ